MNIALVSLSYGDNPTYHTVFGNLARRMRERGHRVVALTGSSDSPREDVVGGLIWLRIPRLLQSAAVARVLARERIETVHLHFPGDLRPYMLWLRLLCLLTGRRFVMTFQDFNNPSLPRLAGLPRFLLGQLARRAHAVSAVSGHVAREVAREFPQLGRVPVIFNGVDYEGFGHPAEPAKHDKPFILFVGRLALYKGVDVLLFAYKDLLKSFPEVDLLLCGPDFNPGHIQSLISALKLEGRARWLGTVEPGQVRSLVQASACVVLPSRQEAFGMAALEAMAAGKPVVASRTGGLSEFIEDGRSGLLVAPKDPEALSAALEKVLGDEPLRKNLGFNARERSKAFDWGPQAEAYCELLSPAG